MGNFYVSQRGIMCTLKDLNKDMLKVACTEACLDFISLFSTLLLPFAQEEITLSACRRKNLKKKAGVTLK